MLYGHFMFAAYSFLLDKIPFCEKKFGQKIRGGGTNLLGTMDDVYYIWVYMKRNTLNFTTNITINRILNDFGNSLS